MNQHVYKLTTDELAKEFAEIKESANELTGDIEHLIENFELPPQSLSHAKHIALVLNRATELLSTTHNMEGGPTK